MPPSPGCVWLCRGFHQRTPSAAGTFSTPAIHVIDTNRPSCTDCRQAYTNVCNTSLPCDGLRVDCLHRWRLP
ncbi:MAG: hypothetical protein IKX31_03585 [Muribaculaceae bacterium]|nr:hypothetical protein [Muribaculaceae bacterium]